jgi:hypothetical protein
MRKLLELTTKKAELEVSIHKINIDKESLMEEIRMHAGDWLRWAGAEVRKKGMVAEKGLM